MTGLLYFVGFLVAFHVLDVGLTKAATELANGIRVFRNLARE